MSILTSTALCLVLLAQTPPAVHPLQVSLTAESQHIVEREPIKLTVEIKNVSNAPVPVVAIDELQSINPMDHVLLQVRFNDNPVVYRKYLGNATDCGTPNPYYGGVPLPPGGIIRFNIYPNVTRIVDSEAGDMKNEDEPTFARQGRYSIRAAYFIPPVYETLRTITGGMVLSDELEVDVEEPSSDDKKVLDAVWQGGAVELDEFEREGFAEKQLRKVIAQEHASKLLPYARFELGRSLAFSPSSRREAMTILAALAQDEPKFRYEEVNYHLARAAIDAGEWQLAGQTMSMQSP